MERRIGQGIMDEIKLSLEAIRINKGLSRPEMANGIGVTIDRYNRLVNFETKMLATELINTVNFTGIPYDKIQVVKETE